MFLPCFFYCIYFCFYVFFTSASKLDSKPRPNLGENNPYLEEIENKFLKKPVDECWRNKHFTTFIIDSLTNKQSWTKTPPVRHMVLGTLTLGPAPNF